MKFNELCNSIITEKILPVFSKDGERPKYESSSIYDSNLSAKLKNSIINILNNIKYNNITKVSEQSSRTGTILAILLDDNVKLTFSKNKVQDLVEITNDKHRFTIDKFSSVKSGKLVSELTKELLNNKELATFNGQENSHKYWSQVRDAKYTGGRPSHSNYFSARDELKK